MKILNREKIYLDTNPQFITLYDEEKRKSYDIIMYRIDYYDFKFYFSSQTYPIDKKEKEKIEFFLIDKFLDYKEYNI